MSSINTTNYNFIKKFRPELYKLAVKMEEDLLITPVSMLAYSTRFLEYILYDIAKLNDYEVDKDIGFVKNIYDLIQQGFIEFDFGDLLIKAYYYRNSSIHNINITKSLKDDKKTAFELNRRLFDIADYYYKIITKDYEKHLYIEPKKIDKCPKEFISTIIKQEKTFDKCIICDESTVRTKSNFCTDCDNLLNYREVLTKIISEKGTNALLRKEDFDYAFKNQLIKDLTSKNILEEFGNNINIVNGELDKYFKLTDEFMEVDKFLSDFVNGYIEDPLNSRFYLSSEYPYNNVSNRIDEYYVGKVVNIMENGFSHQYALEQMGVLEFNLESWYENKKSEFIDGNKDKLFIKYNELLIKDSFRKIEKHDLKILDDEKIDFWSQYFTGFSEKLSKKLIKQKLKQFVEIFKKNYTKEEALNQVKLSEEEFNDAILIHKVLADKYFEEIEKREAILLNHIKEDSLDESLEKAKLEIEDFRKTQLLTEILQQRYLNYRLESLSTHEICGILTIDAHEVDSWLEDDSFKNRYAKVRLELFKSAAENYKTKSEILNELELSEDELNCYIDCGRSGDVRFMEYYDYFENVYYDNKFKTFLVQFRIEKNVNMALKNAELSQNELDDYLGTHDKFKEEFLNLRIYYIVDYLIKKGKINPKFLKKMGMAKKDYKNIEKRVTEELINKQVELMTDATLSNEILYKAASDVNCEIDVAFEFVYKGSLGDEKFMQLAEAYWSHVLSYINGANQNLKSGDPITALKKNINPILLGKYDFDYWIRWGLIDKDSNYLSVEDILEIIKRFDNAKKQDI
ncbi:hypothetical protein [uncultured Methanobrevibacter sp.]|uniref:hypothetical protein n=1 Tax=uncultured Methanobrevibacter sp. TaxID=253161 RepID=UPI0026288168|nr:hypothetical protein [uncultured Methanobrevibacter sp.]